MFSISSKKAVINQPSSLAASNTFAITRLGPFLKFWCGLFLETDLQTAENIVFCTTPSHDHTNTPRHCRNPTKQQTSALRITIVAMTVSLEEVGLAVVAHRDRHNRRRTHGCDDRAVFDIKVNMGFTSTDRNGNRTLTPMATVTKDKKIKTVIVPTMLGFAHLWAAC